MRLPLFGITQVTRRGRLGDERERRRIKRLAEGGTGERVTSRVVAAAAAAVIRRGVH